MYLTTSLLHLARSSNVFYAIVCHKNVVRENVPAGCHDSGIEELLQYSPWQGSHTQVCILPSPLVHLFKIQVSDPTDCSGLRLYSPVYYPVYTYLFEGFIYSLLPSVLSISPALDAFFATISNVFFFTTTTFTLALFSVYHTIARRLVRDYHITWSLLLREICIVLFKSTFSELYHENGRHGISRDGV